MAEWSTLEGLQNFGNWFRRTRHDSALWSPNLRAWFEWNHGFGSKLTQDKLCVWLAEFADDPDLENYTYRVKSIEKWADIESVSETRVKNIKEMNFFVALAQSGFLSLKTGEGYYRPVFSDNIWIFTDVLKGRLNPQIDTFPVHPIGRSAGPKIAAFLDGLTFSNRGKSIHDLNTRLEFVSSSPTLIEKDGLPGSWFHNLILGKIFDLDMVDLEKMARSIHAYLIVHQDKNIEFGVPELVSVISRDDAEHSEMLSEPPYLPPSLIARIVAFHCLGIDSGYENFVKTKLGIDLDRWKKIENGERPTEIELDVLSQQLNRDRQEFIDVWKTDPVRMRRENLNSTN